MAGLSVDETQYWSPKQEKSNEMKIEQSYIYVKLSTIYRSLSRLDLWWRIHYDIDYFSTLVKYDFLTKYGMQRFGVIKFYSFGVGEVNNYDSIFALSLTIPPLLLLSCLSFMDRPCFCCSICFASNVYNLSIFFSLPRISVEYCCFALLCTSQSCLYRAPDLFICLCSLRWLTMCACTVVCVHPT